MKKKYFKIGLLLLLFGYFALAQAAVVQGLYSAQMPVTSRSTADRNQAINQAFQQVLIKVSGHSNVISEASMADVLKQASSYVQEFSYKPNTDNADYPLMLQIHFLSKAINQVLTQHQQAVWSANRPLFLVWMAVQDQSGTTLMSSDSDNPAFKLLMQEMKKRALPVIFPILDLEDLQQVTPSDVWAPFLNVIAKASKRYMADGILVIRLNLKDPNNLSGQWLLLQNNKKMRWETEGSSLSELIQTGVNDVVDGLAPQFTMVRQHVAETREIQMAVSQLQGIGDYTKVVQYLRKLPHVSKVAVLSVSGAEAQFQLTLTTSDLTGLQHDIQSGTLLRPVMVASDTVPAQSADQSVPVLQYQLQQAEPVSSGQN